MQRMLFAFLVVAYLMSPCVLVTADEPPTLSLRAQQVEQSKQQADKLVEAFRLLRSAETPNAEQLRLAQQKALEAMADVLRLELQQRQQRLEAARLRLDALEAQLKRSQLMIDEIASERVAKQLAAKKGFSKPYFNSPQAVMDRLQTCSNSSDYEGWIELLTESAARDWAGAMLMSTASVSMVRQVSSSFGGKLTDGVDLQAINAIDKLIKDAMLTNPPSDALSAYTKLMQAYANIMFSQSEPEPPSALSVLMRDAAGVLKDPRRFIVDASHALERVTGTPVLVGDKEDEPVHWEISVDGDTAIARQDGGQMQLRRGDDGWRISQIFGDNVPISTGDGATGPNPYYSNDPAYGPAATGPAGAAQFESVPTPVKQPLRSGQPAKRENRVQSNDDAERNHTGD